jgi:hypothetical protein
MRKSQAVTGVLVAALLSFLGWTAWRTARIEGELDRLVKRADAPAAAEPSSTPTTALAPAPAPTAPPPEAHDDATARTLADVKARLDSLDAKVKALDSRHEDGDSIARELIAERMKANEVAAIATQRNAISAQAQFQMSAKSDTDADGTGEYGGFLEMSGALAGRMNSPLNPPVLSSAFRTMSATGEVERNGYLYRIYLPDSRGAGVGETSATFSRAGVDADLAETTWCMYAWPVAYGRTGTRTFFTNQGGDVLATDARSYSGPGAGPAADAAFRQRGFITGVVAFDVGANDGNVWKQVN